MTSRKTGLPITIFYVDLRDKTSLKKAIVCNDVIYNMRNTYLKLSINASHRLPKNSKSNVFSLSRKKLFRLFTWYFHTKLILFFTCKLRKTKSIKTSLKNKSSNISTYSTKIINPIKSILSPILSNIVNKLFKVELFPISYKLHTLY